MDPKAIVPGPETAQWKMNLFLLRQINRKRKQ